MQRVIMAALALAILSTPGTARAMAVFKVNTGADSVQASATTCTLRAALVNINGKNTDGLPAGVTNPDCPAGQHVNRIEFTFPAGASGHPEVLLDPALGRLQLTDNRVTIENVTLDGQNGTGIFGVSGTGTALVVRDALLRNGNSDVLGGGGVRVTNGAALELHDVRMLQNKSIQGVARGGHVLATTGSRVYAEHSYFSTGNAGHGGAFAISDSVLTLSESSVLHNFATVAGGGTYCDSGAIDVEFSRFQGNVAQTSGGAVHAGCIFLSRAAHFLLNEAKEGNGGAIAVAGASRVEDSTFLWNLALSTQPVASRGNGGAIHVANSLTLLRSSFHSNRAYLAGGAVALEHVMPVAEFVIANSTFVANEARQPNGTGGRGGAVQLGETYFAPGKARIVNSTFFDNRGLTQLHVKDENGAPVGDIAFENNLLIGLTTPASAPATCGGRLNRLASGSPAYNTQYPGTSCATTSGAIPVVNLLWKDAVLSYGGYFDQPYVFEPALGTVPLGNAATCAHASVANRDQFGSPRDFCIQGAVQATAPFSLPLDITPN